MSSASSSGHLTDMAGIWTGVAANYESFRPRPPQVLPDLLTQLAEMERPRLVVDLGSGTGLSSLIWAERAEEVVGVEPNDDMRGVAEGRARERSASNVRFVAGVSTATGVADGGADIVTASQSLHWMDPRPTFAEVARILRPGGVFAAYDYDWPPLIHWELDQIFHAFEERLFARVGLAGLDNTVPWSQIHKSGHLQRMRESDQFRFTRDLALHSVEECDAERFFGLTLTTNADIYLSRGLLTAEEIGVEQFREEVRAAFGDAPMPMYTSYHLRLGIK